MIKELNTKNITSREKKPLKVLQFGEGNFLRAFADWCIAEMNEKNSFNAGIAIVQPIENGMTDMLRHQNGLYHHFIKGLNNGKEVNKYKLITDIQESIDPFIDPEAYFDLAANDDLKIVISNTTEAGIQFIKEEQTERELSMTFPGKLTQLLELRYKHYNGSPESGLVFIPCELIENNGANLKKCIIQYAEHWKLGEGFVRWINEDNHFGNTLVDRIVPGFPKDEIQDIHNQIGFKDNLVVTSEYFHLWVIQGSKEIQRAFPADQAGLNVKFVEDLTPYRTRKVRILNGAHTCLVPIGLLSKIETVREAIEDDVIGQFIHDAISEEICPTINLSEKELSDFTNEVLERFKNPFIRHELKSISLNSISKFRVRVLPSIKDFIDAEKALPNRLIFSLASLIKLYLSSDFVINDDKEVIALFDELTTKASNNEVIASTILTNTDLWGEDLTRITGFKSLVTECMHDIDNSTLYASLKHFAI